MEYNGVILVAARGHCIPFEMIIRRWYTLIIPSDLSAWHPRKRGSQRGRVFEFPAAGMCLETRIKARILRDRAALGYHNEGRWRECPDDWIGVEAISYNYRAKVSARWHNGPRNGGWPTPRHGPWYSIARTMFRDRCHFNRGNLHSDTAAFTLILWAWNYWRESLKPRFFFIKFRRFPIFWG